MRTYRETDVQRRYPGITLFCVGLLLWLVPNVAAAHHPSGGESAQPLHRVQADWRVGEFELEGEAGRWLILGLTGEAALLDWLSIRMDLPTVRATFDHHASVVGLGNLELGLRFLALRTERDRVRLLFEVGSEFPTRTDPVLGAEHFELGGGAFLQVRLVDELFANLALRYWASLSSDGAHTHDHSAGTPWHPHADPPLVFPHAAQEGSVTLGLRLRTSFGSVGLTGDLIYGFAEPAGLGPVSVGLDSELTLAPGWTLFGGVSLPVAGELRSLWSTRLGLRFAFGSEPPPSCGCGH